MTKYMKTTIHLLFTHISLQIIYEYRYRALHSVTLYMYIGHCSTASINLSYATYADDLLIPKSDSRLLSFSPARYRTPHATTITLLIASILLDFDSILFKKGITCREGVQTMNNPFYREREISFQILLTRRAPPSQSYLYPNGWGSRR